MKFIPFALLGALALAGCSNTAAGLGQDMQNAGANLQSTANGTPTPPSPQNAYQPAAPAYPPPPGYPPGYGHP